MLASELPTYTIDVLDEQDVEYSVTLRRLSAGDHAEVQDLMFSGDEDTGTEGRTRLMLVQKTVVTWTKPDVGPPTPATISDLPPGEMLQIYVQIDDRDLNPFTAAVAARVKLQATRDTAKTEAPAPAPAAADDAG